MSYETRYAARKRQEASERAETPEAISRRITRRALAERVERERAERFPTVTAENIGEILEWQSKRLAELEG